MSMATHDIPWNRTDTIRNTDLFAYIDARVTIHGIEIINDQVSLNEAVITTLSDCYRILRIDRKRRLTVLFCNAVIEQ